VIGFGQAPCPAVVSAVAGYSTFLDQLASGLRCARCLTVT
jgi:hypothetical protein